MLESLSSKLSKYLSPQIYLFFGDPESRGAREDATA